MGLRLAATLGLGAALIFAGAATVVGDRAFADAPRLESRPQGGAGTTDERVYRGTLKIKVAYWGFDCRTFRDMKLRLQKTRTFRMPARVITDSPLEVEGSRETNPFNLIVAADGLREAGIQITSAMALSSFQTGDNSLFQFWKLSKNGSKVSGRLTQIWLQLGRAFAQNLFPTAYPVGQCSYIILPNTLLPIDKGARLTGTLTSRRAVLTVTGRTVTKERRFTARITVTR